MDGPYLNSLIPIVGGVAASAWAPMSSVTTPTATNPRVYHASALVSSFMVPSLPSSHVRTLHHRRRSMRFRKGLRERIAVLGVSLARLMSAAKAVQAVVGDLRFRGDGWNE